MARPGTGGGSSGGGFSGNRPSNSFSNAFRDTANDIMLQSVISGSWTNSKNGWQFTDDNGEVLRDTWAEIDESLYYFTSDGYMATGWIENNGKWYYADENGGLAAGWVLC